MAGLTIALAFITGMLLHDSGVGISVAIPVGLAALFTGAVVKGWQSRIVIGLALALVCLGAWRAQAEGKASSDIVVQLSGTDRSIDAIVIGIPAVSTTRTKAKIKLESPPHAMLDASLPPFPAVADGDVIRFWAPQNWNARGPGEVQLPISPGGEELFVSRFSVVASHPSRLTRMRTAINSFMTRSIEQHVPEPAGSITLGILNGDDSGMTGPTRAAFRSAGMSHITAVSGWNVAIAAGLIVLLLRRIAGARWMTTIIGLALIWSYAFLVGMEPSVTRAGGMASIFLLAHVRGRPGDLLTSLLMMTAVMLAVTPEIRFDLGFQLSVAATLGIVLLLEISDSRPGWRSAFAVPLVAELAVAPLLLHHLGTYSLLSPLANLVTGPLVELVMAGGIATLVASPFHPLLASLAGTFAWVPARLIIAIAEYVSSLRWSSSTTVTLSWSATLVTYLVLILGYLGWGHLVRHRPVAAADLVSADRI